MSTIIDALQQVLYKGQKPEILTDCSSDKAAQDKYNTARKVFNSKFDLKPAYIIFCESEEQVANTVWVASSNNLSLRVCGGKHDHEGESLATGAIVIDFKKMRKWEMIDTTKVSLEPGLRFMDFVEDLAEDQADKPGRIIPRGTCESVGVAGFSMGGGWGPWTRKYGMCCEYLDAARIVLGDGSIVTANDQQNQELLWAIKGGGGFSYGIVTKFIFKTMPAPSHAIKFKVTWQDMPAIKVLERWEQLTNPNFDDPIICEKNNPKLVGTNLKIDAIPLDNKAIEASIHECIFFGYYVGNADTYESMVVELNADLKQWFAGELYEKAIIDIPNKEANAKLSLSVWERVVTTKAPASSGLLEGVDFEPDPDKPAPHKITSRLAKSIEDKDGWGKEGRYNLIKSLRSPLISEKGKKRGVHTYVTLGAIWGEYYNNYQEKQFPAGNAFPYRDRPYTIQYQCWWDVEGDNLEPIFGFPDDVNLYVNKALDWMEESRQRDFPQTLGSFISFKDSSVPTSQYFLHNYERLQAIKKQFSRDVFNRFRSRKTII